jgi:hypothetical protein
MRGSGWLIIATLLLVGATPAVADEPPQCDFRQKIRVLHPNSFRLLENGYTVRGPDGVYSREYRPPIHTDPDDESEVIRKYRDKIQMAFETSTLFLKARLCWLELFHFNPDHTRRL